MSPIQHTAPASATTEDGGNREHSDNLNAGGTFNENANQSLSAIEALTGELRDLIGELNTILLAIGLASRATSDSDTSNAPGIPSATEKMEAGAQLVNSADVKFSEEKTGEDAAKTNGRFLESGENSRAIDLQSSESAGDPIRTELMNQLVQFQNTLTTSPVMSRQDATELLSAIQQLRQSFFEQGQNSVTKQQFQQELAALRRLIESKGK